MAGESKQNEGPMFFMSLGSQLGELKANQEALLGRLEAIEAHVFGSGGEQQQQLAPAPNGQQLAPQATTPQATTPLDQVHHFATETKKLGEIVSAVAELKKLATTFAPLLESMQKNATTTPQATTSAPVQQPTSSPVVQPVSVQPVATGHA